MIAKFQKKAGVEVGASGVAFLLLFLVIAQITARTRLDAMARTQS